MLTSKLFNTAVITIALIGVNHFAIGLLFAPSITPIQNMPTGQRWDTGWVGAHYV